MLCVGVVEDIKANQTMNSKMNCEDEEEEEEMESFDENKKYICWKCNRDFTDECDDRSSFEKKKERMYMCMSCHSDEDKEEEEEEEEKKN
jgi:DNA-directed RNA polymerase subunit RPC12/RpoP